MTPDKTNYWRGVALGSGLGVLLQLGGYFLIRGGRQEFGWGIFVLVPFLSGYAVASVVRYPKRIFACILTSLLTTLTLLLFAGLEGIICCIMAAPLIGGATAIGAMIGYVVRGRVVDKLDSPQRAKLGLILLMPFLMAAANRLERPYLEVQEREVFTSRTTLPVSAARAWDLLVGTHAVNGEKPLLLWAGLPNPTRCELETAGQGGRRVCYFDSGHISQEITLWDFPRRMEIKVTESTLPGRLWLSFIGASYEFDTVDSKTVVTRHTTIGTHLYPRWYWRPLERWGVVSEHRFVFANLERRVSMERN